MPSFSELVNSSNTSISTYSDDDDWTLNSRYSYYQEYADERFSTINDTKIITVDQSQINITQESNSQFIPFKIKRYWDGVDLNNMSILIYFCNANNNASYSSPINVYYNDDYIKFGWLINSYATAVQGQLKFEIQAAGQNSKGDNYLWKSQINTSLSVLQSLSSSGAIEPDSEWATTFLNNIMQQVQLANSYANTASSSAETASNAANSVTTSIANAKTEIAQEVNQTIGETYYTKSETDEMLSNVEDNIEKATIDEIKTYLNI